MDSPHKLGDIGYIISGSLSVVRVKVVEVEIQVQGRDGKVVGCAPICNDGKWHKHGVYMTDKLYETFEEGLYEMFEIARLDLHTAITAHYDDLYKRVIRSIEENNKPLPKEEPCSPEETC